MEPGKSEDGPGAKGIVALTKNVRVPSLELIQ